MPVWNLTGSNLDGATEARLRAYFFRGLLDEVQAHALLPVGVLLEPSGTLQWRVAVGGAG